MLWIVFAVMLLAGALFVCWPLYRQERRLTPGIALGAVGVLALSGVLYTLIGTPDAPSATAGGAVPSVEEMVAGLDKRLRENPDDVEGWKMLGRSYLQLGRFDRAVEAFEQALEREDGRNPQTLAELGEAVVLGQEGRIDGRSNALFEAALAAAPTNSKALFYGGIAAVQRDERDLAADRWEALLALSPPPEVQEILRLRIAEWRGEPLAAADPAADPAAASAGAGSVTVNLTLSGAARAAREDTTTVFVIARDPARPSPPIAATRRKVSELPASVALSDADAMIPGRLLSQFDRLEIVARASLSGEPIASAGDWFGSAEVDTTAENGVDIEIGRLVE